MHFKFLGDLVDKSIKSNQLLLNQIPNPYDSIIRYIYIKMSIGLLELINIGGNIYFFIPIEKESNMIEMLIDEWSEFLRKMFKLLDDSGVKLGTFDKNLIEMVSNNSNPNCIISTIYDENIDEYCIKNRLFYFILIKQ